MSASADDAFHAVRTALLKEPGTSEGTGFGRTPGIRVEGKIAAMFMDGRLVVKLPPGRCSELEASAGAEPLQVGSRTMREWVCVEDGRADWIALAREALAYVRP